ncbi:TATA element modulatory factor 1, partial [Rhizoclosmatium hyalinum]
MGTIVKKLRAKEGEMEAQVKDQLRKIEGLGVELSEVREKLTRVEASERKLGDSLKTATELTEKQAKQIVKLENELVTAKGELSNTKAQLERVRADLQEVRQENADANSAAHAEALEKEIAANELLHKQLQSQKQNFLQLETALQKELHDLRSTLSRHDQESSWKEDSLRKEIASLQTRLAAADSRHEDLFAEARSADRPLVRQIESLQVQHAAARKDWEGI